ncbi:hypothetical protein GCM10010191_82770 [Actinomadura vinacea]|uniref:Uncharacterized protein n=1 Tax=Actinomadura vinacea TaxID=115336 RepID=A0ABP5XC84_9ACTN
MTAVRSVRSSARVSVEDQEHRSPVRKSGSSAREVHGIHVLQGVLRQGVPRGSAGSHRVHKAARRLAVPRGVMGARAGTTVPVHRVMTVSAARARRVALTAMGVRAVMSRRHVAIVRVVTTGRAVTSASGVMIVRRGTASPVRTVPVAMTARDVASVRGRVPVGAGSRGVGRSGRNRALAGVPLGRPVTVQGAGSESRPKSGRRPNTTIRCCPTT